MKFPSTVVQSTDPPVKTFSPETDIAHINDRHSLCTLLVIRKLHLNKIFTWNNLWNILLRGCFSDPYNQLQLLGGPLSILNKLIRESSTLSSSWASYFVKTWLESVNVKNKINYFETSNFSKLRMFRLHVKLIVPGSIMGKK